MKLKTSEEWQEQFKELIEVYDPDGWDRHNFQFSWREEKLTKQEFWNRVCLSTCKFRIPFDKLIRMIERNEI